MRGTQWFFVGAVYGTPTVSGKVPGRDGGEHAARGVVMSFVLVIPITEVTALAFGAVFGVLWLATVPLTSGIVAQVFGTRYFSMLFGIVFMITMLAFCMMFYVQVGRRGRPRSLFLSTRQS